MVNVNSYSFPNYYVSELESVFANTSTEKIPHATTAQMSPTSSAIDVYQDLEPPNSADKIILVTEAGEARELSFVNFNSPNDSDVPSNLVNLNPTSYHSSLG